jgi:hypothetical protein
MPPLVNYYISIFILIKFETYDENPNHHTGDFIEHSGFFFHTACLLNTRCALRNVFDKEHNLFSCAVIFHESGSRTKHCIPF